MVYYFNKTVKGDFDQVVDRVVESLKQDGFGVLTEIDVKETLHRKLGVGFRNYRILGACNPPFAYEALQAEDKIGVMLPCNVIVQEVAPGEIEVAAVDPLASMQGVENEALLPVAQTVRAKMRAVVDRVA
jgi:uncharacterized protein (DUF302 family)